MNGGILPMLLLCAAVFLALGLASDGAAWRGVAAFASAALIVAFLPLSPDHAQVIFSGLFVTTIVTAALVYLPRGLPNRWAIAAGLNGGAWAGALASAPQSRGQLALAVPFGLIFVAKRWLPFSGYTIVIKVIASWVMAIAALSMLVSMMPTPGYMPDHME